MGEGTVFSLFVSSHLGGGGVPQSGLAGGVPHPRSGQGGVLYLRSGQGGHPIPGLHREGGTPSPAPPHEQVWMGYPPDLGWGTPQTWDRVPLDLGPGIPPNLGLGTPQPWDQVPPQTWDWVPPNLGWGTPPDLVPPRPGTRYPPHLGPGTPPGIVSTCYVAGGMSLAFMQEDNNILIF